MKKTEAYKELQDVFHKHREIVDSDFYSEFSDKLKTIMRVEEISEKFDIEIKTREISGPSFFRLSDYMSIGLFGPKYARTISWPDDDKQPNDEWLYMLNFSTGAYTFHAEYPAKTFESFFKILKSYKPKYVDSHNHCLYFSPSNAKKVHGDFNKIFAEHRSKAFDEVKATEIDKLKKKLAGLEGGP